MAAGQTYNRWTVLRLAYAHGSRRYWWCRCECGTERAVWATNVRGGQSQSCGCLNKEVTIANSKTHGLSRTPEYEVWCSMKKRCYNRRSAHFANYGGRGITICDRWRNNFRAFIADMGARPSAQHSIDRINNDGPYAPDNCRWVPNAAQGGNKRSNHRLTYQERTLTIADWSRALGFHSHLVILKRLKRGWTVDRALTEPLRIR
jgi:hypothetical protein